MIVTLWRHAQAADGKIDRLREITVSGRDDVVSGCHRFEEACSARRIMLPGHILHSPLVRTTQTARIIAAACSHATVIPERALQPGGDADAVDDALHQLSDATAGKSHVVLVSHQPLLSHLVGHYLGAGNSVPFLTPGAWVTLSVAAPAIPGARLLFWALPPEYEVQE
jgi:phosphohistidine phosphatase